MKFGKNGYNPEELYYARQQQFRIPVLNIHTVQLECHCGYVKGGRLFINNGCDSINQEEVCEVNIEHSTAHSLVGHPSVYVRKHDLEKDPALYLWFASLEGKLSVPYETVLGVRKATGIPMDLLMHSLRR